MPAIDDLNTAVSNLQTVTTAVVAKLQGLEAQVANQPPDQTPAIEAATAAVNAVAQTLSAT